MDSRAAWRGPVGARVCIVRAYAKRGAAVIAPCLPVLVLGALATEDHRRITGKRKGTTATDGRVMLNKEGTEEDNSRYERTARARLIAEGWEQTRTEGIETPLPGVNRHRWPHALLLGSLCHCCVRQPF